MRFVSILPLTAILLLGCGDESSDDEKGFVGEWETECISLEGFNTRKSVTFFSNGRYEYTEVTFSDQACLTGPQTSLSSTGYYSASGNDGRLNVDFNVEVIEFVPKTLEVASGYNQLAYCGLTSWDVEIPQSLIGKTCADSEGKEITFVNTESSHLQIIDVSNQLGNLQIGKRFLESSSQRQSELDNVIFNKTL